ncbi:MAG: hypothetical protein ACYS74_09615 [Planctomycetota bacterium]|jgi:hypothetical protein
MATFAELLEEKVAKQKQAEESQRKERSGLFAKTLHRRAAEQKVQAGGTLSRKDMQNAGVTVKTSEKERKIVSDVLRRRGPTPAQAFHGVGEVKVGGQPMKDLLSAPKELRQLAGGVEETIGTAGAMAQWMFERSTIGDIVTKHVNIPGAGAIAEHLVRKYGPKKPLEFFDKKMAQRADEGKRWADWWNEQANKGWEAPSQELMDAKWSERPISKGVGVISRAAPNYLAAIAASVLTKNPQVGLTFISATAGASAYHRQRKAGTGKRMADAVATATAAWEYGTEKIPFEFMLKGANKGLLKKMVQSGTLESAQEFVQGIGESFLEHFGYNAKDLKSVPVAVREGINHALEGWVENLVAGFGLGFREHPAWR